MAADPVVENVVSFADVPESSLFHKEISWLAAEGISMGWDVGAGVRQYRPLDSIARDAMAAFLYRKAGSPAYTPPVPSPFTDVAPGAAFYKEITWLASKGISTGWDLGAGKREYRPMSPIARDAMAAFLFRFAQFPQFTAPAQSPFMDVAVGGAFYKEITWLASSGISTGWDIGGGARQYRPLNGIARDAMAAFLYRYAAEKAPADPADPAAGTVTVAPDVEILEPSQLESAQVSAGTVTLPSDQAKDIKPNDVLVSGVTMGTPDGLLARVVQVVRDPGGNTLVKTKPATLPEAVVSTAGLLEVTGTPVSSEFIPEQYVTVTTPSAAADPLSQRALPEAQAEGEVFSQSFSVKQTFKTEVSQETGKDTLSGSGSVSMDSSIRASAKAKMTFEAGFLQVKEASVVLTPSFSAEHTVSVSGAIEGKVSKKLGVLKAWLQFWAGPVPVVVTADALVAANLTVAGEAEIAVTSSQTVSADYGFKYRDGSFNLVNTQPRSTGVQNEVKATASLTARLSLDFDADIKLYGVAGITFGAGPYFSATIAVVQSNGSTTWSCPIELGLESRLGVVLGIELMGFKLERSAVNTTTWNIAEPNPCEGLPVTPPEPKPSPTPTPTPTPTDITLRPAYLGFYPTDSSVGFSDLIYGLPTDASRLIHQNGDQLLWNDQSGSLWTRGWGLGSFGVDNSTAQIVNTGLRNVTYAASGINETYALDGDGRLWAWGSYNPVEAGESSPGPDGSVTWANTPGAVQVPGLPRLKTMTLDHGLDESGRIWSWDSLTQIMAARRSGQSTSMPRQLDFLPGVTGIWSNGFEVYAATSDGALRVWGYIGDGYEWANSQTGPWKTVPGVRNVSDMQFAWNRRFALLNDGTVFGIAGNSLHFPARASGISNATQIIGNNAGLVALTSDRRVLLWSQDASNVWNEPTPAWDFSPARELTALRGAVSMAAGMSHWVGAYPN